MLHKILPIIVLLLVGLDTIFLMGLSGSSFSKDIIQYFPSWSIIFIILQLPILYGIVYFGYIGPVQRLNQSIARFMTGTEEEPSVTANAWSKGMNHVIEFFVKSLQILKIFKQELRDGRKLRSEVEIASEIQRHVIANEETTIPSLEVALATTPASEVG